MEFLEQEIVRLLKDGPMHAGTIRNKLNGFPLGLDVSEDEVLHVLRQLEATYVVECMWRRICFGWSMGRNTNRPPDRYPPL